MRRSNAGKSAKQVSLEHGINIHTTGSKSYARKKKEFFDDNGRDPGKIEFFEMTHTKKRKDKEGTMMFVNEISREKVETAKKLVEERSCESEASSETIESEVCDEIFGCHKRGAPKGYGLGARNFVYHAGYAFGEAMGESEEIKELKSNMNDMHEVIKDLKIQNQTFISMLSQRMIASTSSQDVGFVNLQQSYGDHTHQATGITGCDMLKPTIATLEAGKDIVSTNKESLTTKGSFTPPISHIHVEYSTLFQPTIATMEAGKDIVPAKNESLTTKGSFAPPISHIPVEHSTLFQDGLSYFLRFLGDRSSLPPNFQVPNFFRG